VSTTTADRPGSRVLRLWREGSAGETRRSLLGQILVFVAIAMIIGFVVPNGAAPDLLAVLIVAACYSMLAIGTNVLLGWSGMVTFCQATFFGCGAYTVALVRNWHWPTQSSLLLAIAVSTVLGYVSFWFLSHYSHIAFAMLTLVFGQFVGLVVSGTEKLGATDGFGGILREPAFGIKLITEDAFWWLTILVLLLTLGVYWWLNRRVLALRMFAAREDPGRLETLGYNVRRLRATSGAIAAAFCACGGALYAEYAGAVSPTVLQFDLSGVAVFMCVIGGTRFLWGPLIGAVLYTLTVNYWLQSSLSATMYIGALFVIVMIVLPSGLLSLRSLVQSLSPRRAGHEPAGGGPRTSAEAAER
jgi:branched-chain amino acid transport system permease protein